ncbi:MAG: ribonuclease domain-containing protein [Lachnospiraceae bacterium]|nr:ribonuclease domain-containing protein [Lachnospiraceae bacterium]
MLKKLAKNKPISLNDLAENEQTRQMETIQALVSLNPQDNLAQTINSVEDVLGSYGSKEQVAAFDEYRHKLTKKDIEVLEKFHNNNDYVGMNYWLDNKLDAGWRDILSGMYILTMAKLYQWGAETPKTKGNKGNAAKEDAVKKNDAGEGASGAIPYKAKDLANQIKAKNGTPPQGYKGGKIYQNMPNGSGQKLPEGINYKEYDVNPYIKGQNRGVERIVIGDDGSVWYTNNHYDTFTKLE